MAQVRPRLIVDCDPGHDDAVMLVLAARHADVVGITTVSGNAPLEACTTNALAITELLGWDVPVHSGAARPLLAEPFHAPEVNGESGLDGTDLPAGMAGEVWSRGPELSLGYTDPALTAAARAGAIGVRDTFEFEPHVFHRVPAWAPSAGIAAEVRFP